MRVASRTPLLLMLSALAMTGLAACDFSSQNIEWETFGTYSIEGPTTADDTPIDTPIAIPPAVDAYFYVEAFTTQKQYQWTVEPAQPAEVIRQGEYFVVTFQEAGAYTITVAAAGHEGETTVVVAEE